MRQLANMDKVLAAGIARMGISCTYDIYAKEMRER
jgi:hypothetical protein